MRLYCTPGGTWAGSEKDYKAAMKAEGADPKSVDRKQVDVPTSKPELMEFLTFHRVNPINPNASISGTTVSDSEPVAAFAVSGAASAALDELFEAAPLARQLHLAALACENARARIK